MDHKSYARDVILQEAGAIAAMADRLNGHFDKAVEAILDCKGRVIVSGMGKSGLIGRKITATLNSTGVSSFFLHPAEAVHGDLGLIRPEDILVLISKSGRLEEMDTIIVLGKRLGLKIIVFGGTVGSPLFQKGDIFLDCSVSAEACPNNLVPTSSTTAALVMGDALALALLKARDFSVTELAAYHPAGLIGRRLLKHVYEVHHSGKDIPIVDQRSSVSEMLIEMTGKRLGCVLMTEPDGTLAGIFTDGDLRRVIEKRQDFFALTARDVMIRNPKRIAQSAILDAALAIMEQHSITQLPTVDERDHLTGVLHLHDLLKSKLV